MTVFPYDRDYLPGVKRHLGAMFDFGINDCGIDHDGFGNRFAFSDVARQIERGNPAYLAGMSGIELAREVLRSESPLPEPEVKYGKSPEFWAGWNLAGYSWRTQRRFRDVLGVVSLSQIVEMYPLYHEMDEARFAEAVDELLLAEKRETNLARFRKNISLSQQRLSERSGVPLRSIRAWEQRKNDINKAQAGSLFQIATVLGCAVEDLLER